MPNPAALVNNAGPTVSQRSVVGGYISTAKPVPTKRTEGAWIIVPEHSTTVPLGPCQWNSGNGKAFPKQGAKCLAALGEEEIPRIVWWEGEYEERIVTVKKPLVITGTELEIEKAEAWKRLSVLGYKNSWEDFEAGAKHGEYRKDLFGNVYLRGALKGGVAAEAFVLPAGYRPLSLENFIVFAEVKSVGLVQIATTGAVSITNWVAGSEVKTLVALSQVNFSVE